MKRQIVRIDQEKCDGCGLCVGACAEGAIQLVNGKAVLVRDDYCDGLGACLGDCPQGAITLEERDAAAFDPDAVALHLSRTSGTTAHAGPADAHAGSASAHAESTAAHAMSAHGHSHPETGGCPGHAAFSFGRADTATPAPIAGLSAGLKSADTEGSPAAVPESELCQWPIQLHLVPPVAPYWQDADILLAADCTAFALGGFHSELLRGRRLIIACPKLDNTAGYIGKLAAILSQNDVRSLTVARMEVPCCGGLTRIAERALAEAGKPVSLKTVTIGVRGGTR